MAALTVDAPAWIADLPRDARGFPAPAEAGWIGGQPRLSVVATDRKVALAMRRACAICGYRMPPGTTVYRAFAQSDAAHMRQFEREKSQDLAGPAHLSCMLYSAMVCPYLKERTSRLGKDSTINPGARRGTRAAVMGFRDLSVLIFAQPHQFLSHAAPPPHIGLLDLVEDIGYREGTELFDRLVAAVGADADLIDTSASRCYWTDSKSDQQRLADDLYEDFKLIQGRTPAYDLYLQGFGRFHAFTPRS